MMSNWQQNDKTGTGGWICHDGEECPVDGMVLVQTRIRRQTFEQAKSNEWMRAVNFDWPHMDAASDIMAYRLSPQEAREEV